MMIMLNHYGSMKLNVLDDCAPGRSKATIDLPADLADQPSDLYDRVFAFAFDVLGLQTVELRVRPAEHGLKAPLGTAPQMRWTCEPTCPSTIA
ncbi:MAG TPA: hypothetical protein VF897_20470 [Roseiflexaceae bacterium]